MSHFVKRPEPANDSTRDDADDATRDGARPATLDLAADELRELAGRATALVTEYFSEVSGLPVFPETSAAELAGLFRRPPPEEGEPLERVFQDCRAVFAASRHNGSPRMFGYVASPAAPVGVFAGLLASAHNTNVTSWRSAPAPTEVERTVVGWLASLVGFAREGDASSGGLLTSGGSMANLNALFVAHRATTRGRRANSNAQREEFNPSRDGLWRAGAPSTLYVSDQIHLSVPKAADLLGLGREQVRVVRSEPDFRMDVRDLRERVAADLAAGLRPFCVVASAGTVSTGAVDPLAAVARVAREHDLWFHVDGAYGALAALDPAKRHLFAGLEEADSLSLDPHKWLYTPLGCGCLLLREPERARAAFSGTEEDYIKIYERQPEEAFAFWDYGVELSRPFRALKVWMMLRCYGVRRVAACVAEDNALAAYLARRVEESEEFELLAPVTLGICCFRYVPPDLRGELQTLQNAPGDGRSHDIEERLNELNARVMHAVQRGGRAYVSNALLRGRFALRASVTNFRTTRRDLDTTLAAVRDAARGLVNSES